MGFSNSRHFSWSQETGRLLCAGNVDVVRMWDAHYEKDLYDINVSKKKSAVTALGWEDEHHYVMAIGMFLALDI